MSPEKLFLVCFLGFCCLRGLLFAGATLLFLWLLLPPRSVIALGVGAGFEALGQPQSHKQTNTLPSHVPLRHPGLGGRADRGGGGVLHVQGQE